MDPVCWPGESFLRRPLYEIDPAEIDRFRRAIGHAEGGEIPWDFHVPKWQLLCWAIEELGLLVHGSGNPNIQEFEPRKADDINDFGNRSAVYAASDPLWAMYFAILDRDNYPMGLVNGAATEILDDGSAGETFYWFSITDSVLKQRPFRSGTLYLLPPDGFERDPISQFRGRPILLHHWARLTPVSPVARVSVTPEDFPFLEQIRGHDNETLVRRAEEDPDGFPWE